MNSNTTKPLSRRDVHRRYMVAILLGCLVLLSASTSFAQAENYGPVRVELGLQADIATGGLGGGGMGVLLEPKYNVMDNLSVGLRLQSDILFSSSVDGSSGGVRVSAATLAKADYFFTDGTFRPFASLATGIYFSTGAAGDTNGNGNVDAGSYFGIAPQVGVNLGAVRLAAMYNLLFGGNTASVTTGSQESISPSFLGIELSFRLGGGRRDDR